MYGLYSALFLLAWPLKELYTTVHVTFTHSHPVAVASLLTSLQSGIFIYWWRCTGSKLGFSILLKDTLQLISYRARNHTLTFQLLTNYSTHWATAAPVIYANTILSNDFKVGSMILGLHVEVPLSNLFNGNCFRCCAIWGFFPLLSHLLSSQKLIHLPKSISWQSTQLQYLNQITATANCQIFT